MKTNNTSAEDINGYDVGWLEQKSTHDIVFYLFVFVFFSTNFVIPNEPHEIYVAISENTSQHTFLVNSLNLLYARKQLLRTFILLAFFQKYATMSNIFFK